MKQHTLKRYYSFEGKGLHTGQFAHLTLKPAGPDTGIVFVRTDIGPDAVLPALGEFVSDTSRSTTLSDDKIDEMIATFSRGHVNAYKVLSESMDNGRWTIRIKADIHDDILQTPSASSGSRSIDLSSSEAAAALSAYDAKKDGILRMMKAVNGDLSDGDIGMEDYGR